jgi:type I restriction enzyme S subunit
VPAIPTTWHRVPLKDLVDDRGITYGVVQPGQPHPDGTPIVRVNNITPAGIRVDDVLRIDPEIADRYTRSQLKGGEVLITLVGSVGNVAVVPDTLAGWNVARAVGVVPIRADVSARWVAWWLQSPEAVHHLDARLNTTVQKTLNLRDLAGLEIAIPPEDEMLEITEILHALDDKIGSNTRLGRLVEETAMYLFRAHFIDFVGMELVESDAVPIPIGWRLVPFSDAVEINPRTKMAKHELRPFIEMAAVQPWSSRPSQLGERAVASGSRFAPGDTLMARITGCIENGKGSFLDFLDEEGTGSTEFLVFRAKAPLTPEAVYFYSRWPKLRAHAIASMTGSSGRQRVATACFDDLGVAIPPDAGALRETTSAMAAAMRQSLGLWRESRTLTAVRDVLLPRLMSGSLRVPDTSDLDEIVGPITEEEVV